MVPGAFENESPAMWRPLEPKLASNSVEENLNYGMIDKVYTFLLLTSQESSLYHLLVTNYDL